MKQFLKKWNRMTIRANNPLLGVYPEGLKTETQRETRTHAHSSTTHNTAQTSIKGWTDEWVAMSTQRNTIQP